MRKGTETISKVKETNENEKRGIKGFDKELKCKGFQYKVGKTYEIPEEEVKICESGFHAIDEDESPLCVVECYPPANSRYCEVEIGGKTEKEGGKTVCSKITIGKEIGLSEIVEAHVEWVNKKLISTTAPSDTNTGDCSAATNTGYKSASTNNGFYSAATNTGDFSAATNTGHMSAATNTGDFSAATNRGDYSVATNTGDCSIATNTGNRSAATNTGNFSAATNTGGCSVATNTGYKSAATNTGNFSAATNTGGCSVATNTGYKSAATNTGYRSIATNTGDSSSAEVSGDGSVAVAIGIKSKAKGALGCAIVVTERGEYNGTTYPIISICAAIVDGENIKPDTWYTAKNGKLVEVIDE